MQSIFFCVASPVRKRPVWQRFQTMHEFARTPDSTPANRERHCQSAIGSIRLDSTERVTHVLRTLQQAKLDSQRSIIRKSGVFERSVFEFADTFIYFTFGQFNFVLFTLFCDFAHWRCTVYFHYGRLFTVSTS